jgi:hypothetical protein
VRKNPLLPPPTPGPTNPTPPATKPGADLVINPTDEECKKGWNVGLKWTREQFEQFCAAARAANRCGLFTSLAEAGVSLRRNRKDEP